FVRDSTLPSLFFLLLLPLPLLASSRQKENATPPSPPPPPPAILVISPRSRVMSRLPFAALLFLPLTVDAADLYRVGVAQMDITPSHPIRLNGFGGRRAESEGVYQRIWARALAIEDESKEPALLMTVDVLGIPDDIRTELA